MGTTALTDDGPELLTIENGSVAMLTVTVTGETVSVIVTVDAPPPSPHSVSVLGQCQSDLDLLPLAQAVHSRRDASQDGDGIRNSLCEYRAYSQGGHKDGHIRKMHCGEIPVDSISDRLR